MHPMETGRTAEPVAVIGVGCRFPGGVDSPEALWRLLCSDGDGGEPVRPRRPHADGDATADPEVLAADLLGPSPGGAASMDPQQRILLQMAREALHHAGISPPELAGTDTGVFIGVCTGDDGDRLLDDVPSHEGWTDTAEVSAAAAEGLSHVLDLRGARMAVDTACSTSLVALHLAVKSLRIGQSPLALAGGVDLIRAPGRPPTSAATGQLGTQDGWGGGVVVLKRLSDAERDGDRVLALIAGSAVGRRTAEGSAARGGTPEDVLSRACRPAGISPSTVDYVEAYGTGSRLSGPLGAAALGGVFGPRSAERPCLIGSVTSSIGHLEGVAGIAGVITTVLALQHAEIPASPFDPNPAVDWTGTGLRVVTERTPWPKGEHPRRAGVSSFGYGGTVAHLVLEQAPRGPQPRTRKVQPEASAAGLGCRVPAHGVSAQQGKVVHETPRSDRDRLRPLQGPARPGPRAPLPLRRAHDPRKPRHPVPVPPA